MIYNQSPLTVPTYITAGEPVNASVVNRLVQNSNGLVTRVTESSNNLTVISGNSNVTITANQDVLILCNNTTNITVTLPPASTQYKRIVIKKTANNTNTVTIQRAGSDTIEDPSNPLTTPTATSHILYTPDESITLFSSGNTYRFDSYFTKSLEKVGFKAYKSSANSVNTTPTKVIFNIIVTNPATAAAYNFGTFYDTSTGRFTPLVKGWYRVDSNVLIDASATETAIYAYKNGSEAMRGTQNPSQTGASMGMVGGEIYCNGSTDYIEIYASSFNSTRNLVVSTASFCTFNCGWLRY